MTDDETAKDITAAKVHLRAIAERLGVQIADTKRAAAWDAMPLICETPQDIVDARAGIHRALPLVARVGKLCAVQMAIEGALLTIEALEEQP